MCTNQLLNSTSVHLQEYTAVELLESTNVQKLSQSEDDESDYDDKVVEVPGDLKCAFEYRLSYLGLSEVMLRRNVMAIMTMRMRLTKSLRMKKSLIKLKKRNQNMIITRKAHY